MTGVAVAPALGLCVFVSTGSHAQDSAQRQLEVVPTLTVQQTFTDNSRLSADPKFDSITQISPGIRANSNSGRIKGTLDYSLNALVYAHDQSRSAIQNALSAAFDAEAVENHVFIDGRASISQQTLSAFGAPSPGSGFVNDNATEVSTVSLSPSWRAKIGGVVDAQARVAWTASRSASTTAGDSRQFNAEVGLGGGQGLFGWGLNASRLIDDPAVTRKTTLDTATATLRIVPDPEVQFSLRRGWQAEDVTSGLRTTAWNWGWGADWHPTPRTQIGLQTDEQYFGRSHAFTVQHRLARSLITYSDTRGSSGRDLLTPDVQRVLAQYQQLYDQCLLSLHDTALCDRLARELVGLDPNAVGGFLNSAQSVRRAQVLSWAISGVRTTITISAQRTDTSRIDGVTYAQGDLSLTDRVRQFGYAVGLTHQLTPTRSLSLTTSRLTTPDSGRLPGIEQQSITVGLSETLGPRTTGTLSLRHVEFDSVTNPYNESAVIGSIGFRF